MFVFKMRPWVSLTMAFILSLTLTLNDVTEANDAILIGTVYCDTCFHQHFSPFSHFISGALVAVECGGGDEMQASRGKPRFREEVKTDVKGEFRVILPYLATERADDIKRCSVKLISSSEPDCALAAATSSSIRVKVKTPEYHVFSSGFFTFQPLEQPKRCQWESHANSNDGIIASTPLPSPVIDETFAPIPPLNERDPIGVELHDLAYENSFGSSYHVNRILPPLLVPTFPSQQPPGFRFIPEVPPPPDSMFNTGFQPPPDFMLNAGLQPPPDSMLNAGLQPPPDSMLNPGFQPPPSDPMFNTGFQTPPPDSVFNTGFQTPPPDSVFNTGFQSPPPDSVFNTGFQSPPSDSMFNNGFLTPPTDSMLNPNPLQPPPDSTFDPSQPSKPSLTPQLQTPPPPRPPPPPAAAISTSLPIPSLDPQPDSPPQPPFNPPFPAFPFQPSAGLPRMPPVTNKPPLLYK